MNHRGAFDPHAIGDQQSERGDERDRHDHQKDGSDENPSADTTRHAVSGHWC
jgi:hypothetical protein